MVDRVDEQQGKNYSIEHCTDDHFQWKHMAICGACFRLAPSLCSAFAVCLHRWLHFTCSALFGFSIVSFSFYALDLLHRLKGKHLHCSRGFKNLEWNRIEDKRFKCTSYFMIFDAGLFVNNEHTICFDTVYSSHFSATCPKNQPTDKSKWKLNFESFFFSFLSLRKFVPRYMQTMRGKVNFLFFVRL